MEQEQRYFLNTTGLFEILYTRLSSGVIKLEGLSDPLTSSLQNQLNQIFEY